jgi:uncharacterized SAM-binding protein YcdF (DUF218 family)
MRRFRRYFLRAGVGFLAVGLMLGVLAHFFPHQILKVDSGPTRAGALVVLGGDSTERAERAVELFRAGEAELVICSGYGDDAENKARLVNSAVPAADVLLESKSRTTRENAEFTIAMLRERHIQSAIIVTSWYHSRRALACFEHYAPDIKFYSRPSYFGYVLKPPSAESRAQEHYVKAEYVKLLGYWVRYGICPL